MPPFRWDETVNDNGRECDEVRRGTSVRVFTKERVARMKVKGPESHGGDIVRRPPSVDPQFSSPRTHTQILNAYSDDSCDEAISASFCCCSKSRVNSTCSWKSFKFCCFFISLSSSCCFFISWTEEEDDMREEEVTRLDTWSVVGSHVQNQTRVTSHNYP